MGKLEKNNIILKSTVDGVREVKTLVEDGSNLGIKVYFIKEGEEEFVVVGKKEEVEDELEGLSYQIIKEFGGEEYNQYVEEEDSENIRIIGRSLYEEVNSLIDELEEDGEIEKESDMTLIDYVKEIEEYEPKLFKIRRALNKEVVVDDLEELEYEVIEELNKEDVRLDILFEGFRQILGLELDEGIIKMVSVQYVTNKGVVQSQEDLYFKGLIKCLGKVKEKVE